MSDITLPRSVVEQLLAALPWSSSENIEIKSILRAALAAPQPPAVEQEPVAWKWRYEDGELSEISFESRSECERRFRGYEGESAPLYTHPQNLSCKSNQARLATLWGYEKPQPRQPLTDEQIQKLADYMEAFAQFLGACDVWFEGKNEFAHAIERAHNIGGEQ